MEIICLNMQQRTICYNSEIPIVIHVDNVAVDHELVTLANCRRSQLRLTLLERFIYFIIRSYILYRERERESKRSVVGYTRQ